MSILTKGSPWTSIDSADMVAIVYDFQKLKPTLIPVFYTLNLTADEYDSFNSTSSWLKVNGKNIWLAPWQGLIEDALILQTEQLDTRDAEFLVTSDIGPEEQGTVFGLQVFGNSGIKNFVDPRQRLDMDFFWDTQGDLQEWVIEEAQEQGHVRNPSPLEIRDPEQRELVEALNQLYGPAMEVDFGAVGSSPPDWGLKVLTNFNLWMAETFDIDFLEVLEITGRVHSAFGR
jgi:hypothetical protein